VHGEKSMSVEFQQMTWLPDLPRFSGTRGLSASDGQMRPLGAKRATGDALPLFRKQDPQNIVRTGFGKGTVSVPTAAVRTLDRGLTSARRVVPTVEELQEELRARFATQRQAQTAELETRRPREGTGGLPRAAAEQAAVAQAQGFINALDRTAGVAQARAAGETLPSNEEAAATVQINGQALNYLRRQTDTAAAPNPPTFNVRV
jgi:hypothetical protein